MVEASMEAAQQAKARGMTVVMDGGTMREGSKKLVALVDILIASETFAIPLVGKEASSETALRALHELGPEQVIITLGQNGSIGLNKEGIVRQEAFQVRAKDTTGAGDVYHGAYIYGLLQDWDMFRCMRFASATAALSCQKTGTRAGIPDLKTVHEFLKTHESEGNS